MGKIFDHTQLPEAERWLYDISFDRLNNALADATGQVDGHKVPFSYHLSYISHANLNAAAWHIEPAGCAIGIYSSVPPLVLMACTQYARRCDPLTAMPAVNDKEELIVYDQPLAIATRLAAPIYTETDLQNVLSNSFSAGNTSSPLGLFLTEIALKFIAMHECMHVILGHTRYVYSVLGLRSFLEFSSLRQETIDPTLSRTLEFIADRHTIRGLLIRLWQKDFNEFYEKELLSQSVVNEKIYLLRCIVQACTILFHLFPGNKRSIRQPNLSYPHPYIRMRWLCNELMQEWDEPDCDPHEPLKAMSWAAATLSSNFSLPANWEKANFENFDGTLLQSFADESYREALQHGAQWQHQLYKDFAPVYPVSGSIQQ